MYENIGRKIKIVAKVLCWIGIIAFIIKGLNVVDDDIFLGFFYLLVGPLASWIGSFITYGFGQLVENSDILVEQGYNYETEEWDKDPAPENYKQPGM